MTRFVCFFSIFIAIPILFSCESSPEINTPLPEEKSYMRGIDLSFLPEIEEEGIHFLNVEGTPEKADEILKKAGYNTVRLRLWNNPVHGHSNLEEVATFAKRLRALEYKVWLDFHYSDTWADPATQYKPKEWEHLALEDLKKAVYTFTKTALEEINPDYVQIGNEINHGILWEEGRITNPEKFTELLKEGIKAARTYDTEMPIILHYAGMEGATWFFSLLKTYDVDYDLIGLSYYPKWHGKDLSVLAQNITSLQTTFGKKVLIAETAYPFTLAWNDWTDNIVGEHSQLIADYPASVEGQKAFLDAIDTMIVRTEAYGWCYWAPDWVAFKGKEAKNGSTWENQALFDFDYKYLH